MKKQNKASFLHPVEELNCVSAYILQMHRLVDGSISLFIQDASLRNVNIGNIVLPLSLSFLVPCHVSLYATGLSVFWLITVIVAVLMNEAITYTKRTGFSHTSAG